MFIIPNTRKALDNENNAGVASTVRMMADVCVKVVRYGCGSALCSGEKRGLICREALFIRERSVFHVQCRGLRMVPLGPQTPSTWKGEAGKTVRDWLLRPSLRSGSGQYISSAYAWLWKAYSESCVLRLVVGWRCDLHYAPIVWLIE